MSIKDVPAYNKTQMANPARRTKTKTFRLFKDQLEYIEKENGDCSSLFLRFLLDAWMDGKIPLELKREFFAIRKDIRQRAENDRLKRIIIEGVREEENAEV